MLTVDGRHIDYVETGDGAPVLFLPGSYSTYASWRGIQKRLPPRYRMVGTSLLGYGATQETRTTDDHGMEHELRVVEAVAAEIGEPVHLVGHSFGGQVALAAALAGAVDALSIATFEANPFHPVRERGRTALADSTRLMSQEFEAALRAGERDAPARIIDFWGGDGYFAAMPEAVQEYCRSTAEANVLDWRTAFSYEAPLSEYANLHVPVLLVRGGRANPLMVEITDALAGSLPTVRTAVVDGAGHFLNTSHAEACSRLLTTFLNEVD